jgi:hypothetical protein
MKRTRSHANRTLDKTFEKLLSLKLLSDYSLSPVEAQTLALDIKSQIDKSHNTLIKEGEIFFTAVISDEPAGKPLIQCKTKQIKLNPYPAELIELFYKDHKLYNKLMVQRLCWEAIRQDCTLTQEDLSRLLHCSVSTIRRIIAEYRRENIFIPTRGNYCDIGPGISHKTEAIKRYLKGYTLTEIARAMSHNPGSIERYIDDFSLVYSAYICERYSPLRISQMMRISEKLASEYISLYQLFKDNPDCHHRLEQIRIRASELFNRSKKNEGN